MKLREKLRFLSAIIARENGTEKKKIEGYGTWTKKGAGIIVKRKHNEQKQSKCDIPSEPPRRTPPTQSPPTSWQQTTTATSSMTAGNVEASWKSHALTQQGKIGGSVTRWSSWFECLLIKCKKETYKEKDSAENRIAPATINAQSYVFVVRYFQRFSPVCIAIDFSARFFQHKPSKLIK